MAITPPGASDAPSSSEAKVERLRERVAQLEAVARLNLETIRNMRGAAAVTPKHASRAPQN